MTYEEACKIAFEHFKTNGLANGLFQAFEAENGWIFFEKQPKDIVIGTQGIMVNKASGGLVDFFLPSRENFAVLDAATEVAIPEIYQG